MPKVPHQVADFIALPVRLQSKSLSNDVEHYIYLKAYEPKIPDEESPRAIFAVNIPVTSTEAQLRYLFTTQLSSKKGGGQHIQRIYFAAEHDGMGVRSASSSSLIATTSKTAPSETSATTSTTPTTTTTTLGKRKRKANAPPTASELAAKLSTYHLPSTSPSTFHSTGSTAVIVFLDRTARDLALRACRKAAAAAAKSPILWPGTATSTSPPLGHARYAARRELTFPSRADLLRQVDEYMTAYAELEGARAREAAKQRAEPDADGFVMVTRGSRGVVTAAEASAMKERLEAKKKRSRSGSGLDDFYRFQMRERRKEEQGRLLRQFEEDKRRVEEMRSGRGRGTAVPES